MAAKFEDEGADMTITSNLIQEINHVASENFDKARGMLDMLNTLCGTKYGWLAKRVIRFENPDGSVAERYARCHDLVAELRWEEKMAD